MTTFNVRFLDRYNIDMYKVENFPESQVDLFYSCGDNNYKFDISYLYNGPEYFLNINRPENITDGGYFKFIKA